MSENPRRGQGNIGCARSLAGTKRINGALVVLPLDLGHRYTIAACTAISTACAVGIALVEVRQAYCEMWWSLAAVTGAVAMLQTCHQRVVFDRASGKIRKQTRILGMPLAFSNFPIDRCNEIRITPHRRSFHTKSYSGGYRIQTTRTYTYFLVEVASTDGTLKLQDLKTQDDAVALAEAVQAETGLPVKLLATLQAEMARLQSQYPFRM